MNVVRKKYLVHVEFDPCTTDRLKTAVPYVSRVLADIGNETPAIAYRSLGGDQCGFFVAAGINSAQIVAALESPDRSLYADGPSMKISALTSKDSIVVIELGDDAAFRGRTRAGAWFQHR